MLATGDSQDTPPVGWRLIHLLPLSVNLALEPISPRDVKRAAFCPKCFAAPVIVRDVFSRDG